ncbi:MAG: hypothetical protein D6763_11520 [Alphaproteobacteria bacterium]|nr:MAG: hypothetical protein D6763_11520 [Alphaproteobacteria bacterium]
MRALNWRRGLLRLWLVFAVLWIGAVGWILRPDEAAVSYWKLRSLDEAYIAAEARPDEDRCKRPDGSLEARCMSAEWQRAQAARDYMKEALARKEDSLSSLKFAAIVMVGPIVAALVLGFVFGWVARGFSPD